MRCLTPRLTRAVRLKFIWAMLKEINSKKISTAKWWRCSRRCRAGVASLLPYGAIRFGRPELWFGIGAERAPCRVSARLQDGTARGRHRANVRSCPHLTNQAVHPALQPHTRQPSIMLRLLHLAQMHRDVQDRVQPMEALLHVAVLGWTVVHFQSVVCAGKETKWLLLLLLRLWLSDNCFYVVTNFSNVLIVWLFYLKIW